MNTHWYTRWWMWPVYGVGAISAVATALPSETISPPLTTEINNLESQEQRAETTSPITAVPTDVHTASNIAYDVVKVVDGDTISIRIGDKTETVRLIGINSPESVDPRKPVECFGKEASLHLSQLLTGKSVMLADDPTQDDRDKYNRILRYVHLPSDVDINLQMITDGYAYEYTYNIPYQRQSQYKQAENSARSAKRGLWADTACVTTSDTPVTTQKATITTNTKWDCSQNIYNCSNFSSQSEAQETFEACGGTSNDIHQLDRDGDGRVCESLK